MTLTAIDLCCGLGGWQEPFRDDDNWRTVGFDVTPDVSPDVIADVRSLPISQDVDVTVVTASPPCQPYSTAWNRWCPLPDRDPDTSVWDACRDAMDVLNPEWWIIENVAGAQHFFGPSRKHIGAYHFWGEFPPFNCGAVPAKGSHGVEDGGGMGGAKIPAKIATSLKDAVETQTKLGDSDV